MLRTEKEQADFCTEFNISDDKFRSSRLTWEELDQIAEDFERKRNEHQNTVMQYAEVIQKCLGVHSLSYRVKETKHLIEKIIRKNPQYLEKGDSLSINNYEKRITDLMGIRILLLFKEDWIDVHNYLMEECKMTLLEPPFVYVREGDDTRLYEGKVEVRKEKPYRSVHYVIQSDKNLGIEIQVRTLYEEVWSEISRLKYFHDISRVNYVKFIAYTASWCLKRKPFQMIEGCDEEYMFINERFALTLLLQAGSCYDENANYYDENQKDLVKGISQIYYHLKYRNTNPQTLELFLIGLENGRKIYTT